MDTEKHLHAINLSCIRQHRLLFSNISFRLKSGEVLLIEGPNGSGKSSLLRLLTGLSTPNDGDILWQQQSIHSANQDYTNNLHYIGHANGIKPGLSVIENLQLASQLALLPAAISTANIEQILLALQLNYHQHTLARFLSAGQKRRLALARLFMLPKTIWLLDEPLTALDAKTQAFFLSQLETHLKNGGIAILSSHQQLHLPNVAVKTLKLES